MSALAVSPGRVNTQIFDNLPPAAKCLLRPLAAAFFQTPKQARGGCDWHTIHASRCMCEDQLLGTCRVHPLYCMLRHHQSWRAASPCISTTCAQQAHPKQPWTARWRSSSGRPALQPWAGVQRMSEHVSPEYGTIVLAVCPLQHPAVLPMQLWLCSPGLRSKLRRIGHTAPILSCLAWAPGLSDLACPRGMNV